MVAMTRRKIRSCLQPNPKPIPLIVTPPFWNPAFQVDSRFSLSKESTISSATQPAGGKDEDGSDDQEKNQKLSPAKSEADTAHSNTSLKEFGSV
jgi:hypothetical protein